MIKPTLLFETLKIEIGKISNLAYHQERVTRSRITLYHSKDILNIAQSIIPPTFGLFRCRIVYHTHILSIEYIPYKPKNIHTLHIVSTQLDYALKYVNRKDIDTLKQLHLQCDDILMEKNGYITDTSIANIAFFDGGKWYTPKKALLEGTTRSKLIKEGFLVQKDIKKEDLGKYSHVALMNAMIGFNILKNIKIYTTQGIIYDY